MNCARRKVRLGKREIEKSTKNLKKKSEQRLEGTKSHG